MLVVIVLILQPGPAAWPLPEARCGCVGLVLAVFCGRTHVAGHGEHM